ncbi:MAG: hypothetical protein A3K19_21580 [Lentisphaerae bacterium RIFOXYB12_FULL_65_16]|nr:MAG: hypothetical protein A3K18_20830 [Lentisphaerae bacterium RIFOXYA12_64_32]OGV93860.1 MAG: hypothetical protein A3K19_21580 [Lentisphaerae bacterium RIFOXYB12_FULL_65_16]
MSDKLDFSLPERKEPPRDRQVAVRVLLVLILLAVLADVALSARGRAPATPDGAGGPSLSAEAQKDLALRLENQGLSVAAAEAWEKYLRTGRPDAVTCANLWYRIGKLRQDAEQFEKALEGYYRSESFAKPAELGPEIGRRTQECLERLGKFAALRYELTDRVSAKPDAKAAGDEVLAEIGPEKITKADLDRRIEEQIGRQLAQFASQLTEEQRRQQKEELLKRFSTAQERLQYLQQYVAEEVLYRRARETKLDQDAETRAFLKDMEKQILARKVVEKEMSEQIKITGGDVETYYQAHAQEFVLPARARVSHILVENEEKAKAVLESLKNGEAFDALAKSLSLDQATAASGGDIEGWVVQGNPAVPGIGSLPEAVVRIFSTDAGKVAEVPVKGEKGYHIFKVREREAGRQRPFDEAKDEAHRALRSQKEQEVQKRLLEDLKRQYDVVVHLGAASESKGAPVQKPKAQPTP